MKTLLIIGDPSGSHSLRAIKLGFSPENIWVWESDSTHFHAIKQISDKINLVEDLESLDMHFTYGIGNPPFKGQLHLTFLKECLERCDNVRLIHPSGWLYRNNTKLEYEVKQMLSGRLSSLKLFNGNSSFTGMEFQSPLVITEAVKKSDSFVIEYATSGNKYELNSINDLPCGYWEPTETNLELKKLIYKEASISNLHSIFGKYDGGSYLNINEVVGHHSKNANEFFMNDFYAFFYRNSNMNDSKLREKVVNLNSDTERDNLVSYLKTKFARFALSLNKVNSWNVSKRYFEAIPIPSLDHEWNDVLVKEHYNLTESQWDSINSFIPDYYR